MNTRLGRRIGIAVGLLVAAVIALCPEATMAQGRESVRITSPGGISQPGSNSSISTFRNYSSGLGALDTSSAAPLGGGAVLRSSIGAGLFRSSSGVSSPLYSENNNYSINGNALSGSGAYNASPLRGALGGGSSRRIIGSPGGLGSFSRGLGSGRYGSIPALSAPRRSLIGNSPLVTRPVYQDLTDPLAGLVSSPGRASAMVGFGGSSAGTFGADVMGAGGLSSGSLTGGFSASGTARGLAASTALQAPSVVSDVGGSGIGGALVTQSGSPTAFGLARAFVQELDRSSKSLLRSQSQPITSLVPTQPSTYRTYMQRGDQAFRQGNYREAYANFQIANDLGDHDPESIICMLHSEFALSSVSYAKPCYYLEQALKYMPELPMVNLRPRGFYDSQAKYAKQFVDLQEYVDKNPADHEATLVLAYFTWFQQDRDVKTTKLLLSRTLAAGEKMKDPLVIEAVETFWRGIVATGAATGQLTPTSAKAPNPPPRNSPPRVLKSSRHRVDAFHGHPNP